jgi:hypothetical protein
MHRELEFPVGGPRAFWRAQVVAHQQLDGLPGDAASFVTGANIDVNGGRFIP